MHRLLPRYFSSTRMTCCSVVPVLNVMKGLFDMGGIVAKLPADSSIKEVVGFRFRIRNA
jgi:hypothetical protein